VTKSKKTEAKRSRWNERFMAAYIEDRPPSPEGKLHRRVAFLLAGKCQALGLDPRKSGLLAARVHDDIGALLARRASESGSGRTA